LIFQSQILHFGRKAFVACVEQTCNSVVYGHVSQNATSWCWVQASLNLPVLDQASV